VKHTQHVRETGLSKITKKGMTEQTNYVGMEEDDGWGMRNGGVCSLIKITKWTGEKGEWRGRQGRKMEPGREEMYDPYAIKLYLL
jgi:hypothetical protein